MDAYSLVTYVDFTYKNKFSDLTEDEFISKAIQLIDKA